MEPVEKTDETTVVEHNNIEEAPILIDSSQEPLIIGEQVESPEVSVEPDSALEPAQAPEATAESTISLDVNIPEQIIQAETFIDAPMDVDTSEPPVQVEEPAVAETLINLSISCVECGSVLPPGVRFCTNCGTPAPVFRSERVEKTDIETVEEPQKIKEAPITIVPPQESVNIEEQVESLGSLVEPYPVLEQVQVPETVAESTISTNVYTPEPPIIVEEPAVVEPLMEAPISCVKCGSVLAPGVCFCTTCGTPIPNIALEAVEKIEEAADLTPQSIGAASISIDSSQEPVNIEEQIESPEELVKFDSKLEPAQALEAPAESIITLDAEIPESSARVEELAMGDPLEETPISCVKCGSVLSPGVRFCTTCGMPALSTVLEPVEKIEEAVVIEPQNIEEAPISIDSPHKPVIIEEPVESIVVPVVPDAVLEQTQIPEILAGSTIILEVNTPEPPVLAEEPRVVPSLLDAPTVVEEPALQEIVTETSTVELPVESQSDTEKSEESIDSINPVSFTQGLLSSNPLTLQYCTNCGSVLPPEVLFCPSCGSSLLPAPRRKNRYFLLAGFVLILCIAGTLVLNGFGMINFSDAAVPPLPLPTTTREATGVKPIPLTSTSILPKPTDEIIQSTKVITPTSEPSNLPLSANTPNPAQSSSKPTRATVPCVSYYDKDNTSLKLACLNGTTWEPEVVDKSGDVGLYSSLAFDRNKNAHISYYDQSNNTLKYTVKAGDIWKIESVDSGNVGLFPSLVLDENDNPWISYYDQGNGGLKLAHWDGNKWNIQNVDTVAPQGKRDGGDYKTSLALDLQGFPLIAYHHYGVGVPKLARWTGDRWDIQTIDPAAGSGEQCSLALDAKGNPGVSYYDGKGQNLKYAQLNGSSWDIQVVDRSHEVGKFSSLTFDSKNYPRISYFDEYNDNLKYAFWSGKSWVNQTVDSFLNTGFYTSIALDKNDHPYIAYYYFKGGDLRVTNWDGENWIFKNVDTIGKVGLYPSIRFMMAYP